MGIVSHLWAHSPSSDHSLPFVSTGSGCEAPIAPPMSLCPVTQSVLSHPASSPHRPLRPRRCRSSEWGVQPAHWYFTAALPKALLAALPLIAAGALWERRVRPSVVIGLTYVCIYSTLPHKEVGALAVAAGLLTVRRCSLSA